MPPRPTPPPPPRRSVFRQLFWFLLALCVLVSIGFAIPALFYAQYWWAEAVQIADLHQNYQSAHPGWSFPARVQTAEVSLEGLPNSRAIAEAKARDYIENCKDTGPGEFCTKTGKVIPRQGNSLEPVELGMLIGPDGEVRIHLPLKDAPKRLLDAIMASEDRDFYTHTGVNFSATGRALLANAQEGGYAQGASTLSMQVVRNLVQKKEKTIGRKAKEMVMAIAMDQHLGKEGILQMYLDAPYLGQDGSLSVCGFQAAANFYYDKDARALSLGEAATLAAILPAPGRFSPSRHPDIAKERRDRVLDQLQQFMGYPADQIAAAKAEAIQTAAPKPRLERFPAYLSATRAYLESTLPPAELYGTGLTVTVGMDVAMQIETDKVFSTKVPFLEGIIGRKKEPLQSAGILMDHSNGQILAIWGGNDVTAISFNRATQAMRQPGSSFKPLIYSLAFEQPPGADGKPAYTAASAVPNSPRVFKTPQGNWSPKNTNADYSATACLAQGLAWSQNIATASLLELLGGPKPLKVWATQLGFDTSAFPDEMGLALGQGEVTVLEMATFAGEVANGGLKLKATPVLQAVDPNGIYHIQAPTAGERVMRQETAELTRELMRLVVTTGTGGAARGAGGESGYQGPMMGKTGTTDRERDLWFVGATPRYSAALWLGYDQPTPLGWAASDLAAPLWGWWVARVTKADGPPPNFEDVIPLEHRGICRITGKVGNATCPLINAPFLKGTAPKSGCSVEHPPPEPKDEIDPETGEIIKRGHESLWKKRAREAAEREAAENPVPLETPPVEGSPPVATPPTEVPAPPAPAPTAPAPPTP